MPRVNRDELVYGATVIYDAQGKIVSTSSQVGDPKKKKKAKLAAELGLQQQYGMSKEFNRARRAGLMLGGGAVASPSMLG